MIRGDTAAGRPVKEVPAVRTQKSPGPEAREVGEIEVQPKGNIAG